MHQMIKDAGIAIILGLIIPTVLLGFMVSQTNLPEKYQVETVPLLKTEQTSETVPSKEMLIPVLFNDGSVVSMELADYLTGVVLAEMPVSFEEEALKAQTVVARTYTIRAATGASKHSEAAVCSNSSCCQSFIATEDFISRGGSSDDVERIRSFIADTENEVLTYDGKLIEATYFSCSGGSTEDAVAVWGTDVPYLQSVESPGEEHAAHYEDSITFSTEEFASKLGISPADKSVDWFGQTTYTEGGGVATMSIAGRGFSGTELRKLLGLRSTAFRVECMENSVTIITRGYGHRVGMSQYGADAMAASGSTYPEILAHYYQGTVLTQYAD